MMVVGFHFLKTDFPSKFTKLYIIKTSKNYELENLENSLFHMF